MYMKKILFFVCTMLTWLSTDATAKTLVVYYSYTGNSREIVNTLTSQIEADVLEIQPAEKGLKYEADNYALGTQLLNAIKANPNDAGSYPAIDPVTISPADYQNIIIVTPLWWSQMAAITQAYLFQNASKMAGKHVGMIVSSHSSGISGVVSDAERLLPHVTWMGDALWINASNHSNRNSMIENWLPTQNFHSSTTGISHVKSDIKKSKVYTLQGTLALVGQKGIVIKDGKKLRSSERNENSFLFPNVSKFNKVKIIR